MRQVLSLVYIIPSRLQRLRTHLLTYNENDDLKDTSVQSLVCFTKNITKSFNAALQHLVKFTHPTAKTPILLIMDNHASHCSLENVIFAKAHYVPLLTFPLHFTQQMRPLDVRVFRPFKKAMKYTLKNEIDIYKDTVIDVNDLPRIMKTTFLAAFTPMNIIFGLRKLVSYQLIDCSSKTYY